ncbi:mitochondrial inner membrane protease ATP23 homolog [Watersipora subatra]|uniref:mitochondrial inner membrane protease ATP23 homolog n=1 Tax=Watersipora subatra TaxID=2589382 RepID=UPI00355B8AE5
MSDKEANSQSPDPATSQKWKTNDPYETYGYEFFPTRDSEVEIPKERSWYRTTIDMLSGRWGKELNRSMLCQFRVIKCVEENTMVKLLLDALKSRGCEFKLSRHVSCEECGSFANGGYDSINKQVVVCSNNSTKQKRVCNVLSHELIHAFDDCRAKMDLSNIEHLACTEIRAANMMHCSMTSAMAESPARSWGKQQQQQCVRWKARNSILSVRNVSKEEADAAVDRVFDKCYPDLEPLGRIPRDVTIDARRLYVEASLYGYTEDPYAHNKYAKR